jgi:hypothetical protein
MTTEIDILKMAVNDNDKAIEIKKMNERLFEQLTGSLYYICKYAEKDNLPLPEKELAYDMIKRCQHQFENIIESVSPPKNKHPFSTPDDETEPSFTFYYL